MKRSFAVMSADLTTFFVVHINVVASLNRNGRTGERFMDICKSQQIHNYCQPNAIMTLKEYLEDYASVETKKVGEALIAQEVEKLQNANIQTAVKEDLVKIHNGERDFTF